MCMHTRSSPTSCRCGLFPVQQRRVSGVLQGGGGDALAAAAEGQADPSRGHAGHGPHAVLCEHRRTVITDHDGTAQTCIQWNLSIVDTFGGLVKCPVYSGTSPLWTPLGG